MRTSTNEYREDRLWDGFDYERQAWVQEGRYMDCGHPQSMTCSCYGRLHENEETVGGAECCDIA